MAKPWIRILPLFLSFLILAVSASAQESSPSLSKLKDPKVVIQKAQRLLTVYAGTEAVKTYPVALGFDPAGSKIKQGDGKTPEGDYRIVYKNPWSNFHLSLQLNYPNNKDAERGLDSGLIDRGQKKRIESANKKEAIPPQNSALGGEIFIHGGGTGWDWTLGCIALKNADIEELYHGLPLGTPVMILP